MGNIAELKKEAVGVAGLEAYYTIAQLREWSGESESCWRKRLGRGELQASKFGANTRIAKTALDDWLRRQSEDAWALHQKKKSAQKTT